VHQTLAFHSRCEYHVDIPLTMELQRESLLDADFARVEVLREEGEAAAYVAKA
jgi:hypothetical protein